MKKLLLSLGVFASFAVSAQIDTLNNHFVIGQLGPTLPPSGAGWVAGNNDYGDLSKMQLFDNTYGVTGAGTITNVLIAIPVKTDNGGSFDVKIWADNNGTPGAELGTANFPLSQVDTSVAAIAGGLGFIYNVNATFNVPVPSNNKFWAGVVLPTTAGDTLGILTSDTLFTDAITHTGEFWSDNSFHTFGDPQNWGLNVSLAVFPVINFGGSAGIAEKELGATVYPNPANNELNFKLNANASTIEVMTMDGKIVLAETVNAANGTINISDLESGMYMYVITTEKGAKATSTFVKK